MFGLCGRRKALPAWVRHEPGPALFSYRPLGCAAGLPIPNKLFQLSSRPASIKMERSLAIKQSTVPAASRLGQLHSGEVLPLGVTKCTQEGEWSLVLPPLSFQPRKRLIFLGLADSKSLRAGSEARKPSSSFRRLFLCLLYCLLSEVEERLSRRSSRRARSNEVLRGAEAGRSLRL